MELRTAGPKPNPRRGGGAAVPETEGPLLRAEGLERWYGGRRVVARADLSIDRGDVVAVLGPNGAGKSTLFRMLALLEPADAGRILFDGRRVGVGDGAAMRRMASVFQRPYLFAGTVESNVEFGLRARGLAKAERGRRVAEALEWLGLGALAGARVHALSGGEAQRVALARAVVLEPDLLLLDEPTANLDVTVRRRFREDLERLVRTRAGAALLITHEPGDAFALADRIAVMQAGRIAQTGTPDEVVLDPATPFVAEFTGAELLLDGTVAGLEEGLVRVDLGPETALLAAPPPGGEPPAPGAAVHVAYRPEDVVLARAGEAPATSARNRFRMRVAAIRPAGPLVRVRLEGDVGLAVLVTRGSADALDLAPDHEVTAQLKAAALRVFPAPGPG